ncbi:MAG TPA: serine/threonine-protein kinase [Chroococcales cyanobacterium]
MAELTVNSQCNSDVRKLLNGGLDVTFPIWGVISPGLVAILIINAICMFQQSSHSKGIQALIAGAFFLSMSIICLLTKRALQNDRMIVDKRGIKLPRLFGNKVELTTSIPWSNISLLSAVVSEDDPTKGRMVVCRKKGSHVELPLKKLQPEFIEQILIASEMWAPEICDESLKQLQNVLRIDARETANKSYTDLWEEELGRRFCPTAYIPLEPGKSLRNNTLKVVSQLTTGGLSALYLCQMNNKELVVLKESVIPADSIASVREKAKEMFDREALLLMKLDHPNIVHVIDSFTEAERNYLLIEYVNGADLRQIVRQNGPRREIDVLEWAIQICTALKYLHEREQPIIHRDVSPDNMVLGNDGKVTLVDFGAANEFIGTATGTFVGKHAYIAPEQLRGKASVQSDIYALGCTLFFLLTGQDPEALSVSNPKELVPAVSDEMAEVVRTCTQLEAANRYPNMTQLLPVLKRLAAQSIVV